MAYRICPNCKTANKEHAKECVHCGYLLKNVEPIQKEDKKRKWMACIVVIVPIFLLILFTAMYVKRGVDGDSNYSISDQATTSEQTSEISEYNTEEAEIEEINVSIEEAELYNDGNYAISVVSGNNETLNFKFENNSDKNIAFQMDALSVNGVTTDYYDLGYKVASGKQLTQSYDLSSTSYVGSDYLEYVDFTFWIVCYDDLSVDMHTPVLEVKTNQFNEYNEYSLSGNFIYDNVSIQPIKISDDYACYCITNMNDEPLYVDLDDYCVNDCNMQYNSDTCNIFVFPNQIAYTQVNLDDDFKNLNGISSVDKVDFKISLRKINEYLDFGTSETFQAK